VNVRPIDPRDQDSEVDHPAYRVLLYGTGAANWWEITGADVLEVVAWAEVQPDGQNGTFTVYATLHRAEGVELVRLHGPDPYRKPGTRRT
jgi:hypothetical protein